MDFHQLAQELDRYCTHLQSQVVNNVFPLDTTGLTAVQIAMENEEFIATACKSLQTDYQYRQCTQGAFALSHELLGLQNAVNYYNNAHSKYTLYMITSDLQYVKLYVKNLL